MSRTDPEPDYTRLVVDSDVLAADLLVGGPSRAVLDTVRSHSWLELVVTDPLLNEAEAIVRELSDPVLAEEWHEAIDTLATTVEQPEGDRPVLAAAYRGNAMYVVSLDDRLQSAKAGANLRGVMNVSVRSPDAFASIFDPEAAYEMAFDEPYPGPDRDPRH